MKSRRWSDFALLWQAALVILPVAILSGVALYYLREDKASIEQEARDRASVLAPELARRLGERVGEALKSRPALPEGVILDGRIQSPPDYARLPEPPDWPDRLTPSQARANAELSSLVLESKGAVTPRFVQRCVDLAKSAAGAQRESGAPIADLALLLALRHTAPGRISEGLLAELTRAVLEHPSFLTPELLEAAAGLPVGPLQTAWEAREKTLALMRTLQPLLVDAAGPREIWLREDAGHFLAICNPNPSGWRVALVTSQQFEQMFQDALRESRSDLPAYAGAVVEIGGDRWRFAGRALNPGPILASAPGRLEAGSPHPFTLDLDLADPDLLYASYRRRMWLTAGLILSAAAAAMAGLASLWRNSRRQALLSEMKSNFVSSVSHELRAPIAAVRLMAESLDRGKIADEAKQKDYFRLIVQECRRLSALVENVLDFSRIDQGRKQYSFEPTGVVALVRQAVALMEPCAAERQVSLKLAGPPPGAADLRPCWDEHAVEQSLVNLLDNAIKHSPAGTEVRVAIELVEPATVRLWVEDRGEGIPKEEQSRIFDLFYRHGSELRRETQGAGIGLSIVKHVAEAHGGRVFVYSAPGQGSQFVLELPCPL
jgi:signal transduction histidine kinase